MAIFPIWVYAGHAVEGPLKRMANTAKEMIIAVGARVSIRCEDLAIECIVEDVKSAWGKERLLVKPVAGTGSQWVEMGRVIKPEVKPYNGIEDLQARLTSTFGGNRKTCQMCGGTGGRKGVYTCQTCSGTGASK